MREAHGWLERLDLVPLSSALLMHAVRIPPLGLRSLDAIHLATALRLGSIARGFFTYDRRLGAAAADVGLIVHVPR